MIKLNKREKILVQVLIVFVGVLIIYFLIVSPFVSYRKKIASDFENNINQLKKLEKIYEKYKDVKDKKTKYDSLLNVKKGVTTLIEENADSVNIRKNIVYTRDNPTNIQNKFKKVSTDVKFEGVDIKSFLKFLHKMENSNQLIKIDYIRINLALKGRETYDITIKFDSLTAQ